MGDVLKKGTRNMGSIEYTQRSDGKFNKWELLRSCDLWPDDSKIVNDKTWVISGVFDYEIVIND